MVHTVDPEPVPATLEARHEYTLDETPVHHICTLRLKMHAAALRMTWLWSNCVMLVADPEFNAHNFTFKKVTCSPCAFHILSINTSTYCSQQNVIVFKSFSMHVFIFLLARDNTNATYLKLP